jgi:aspartyl-tRNA(Asn)/glutamyl-tRNA(Gln) amidotransferase subunit A
VLDSHQLQAAIDDPAKRSGIGALELVDALLARTEHAQPVVNGYISVMADAARADARQIDEARARGDAPGPLDGMPVAIKDNIDVAGAPTTVGSRFFGDAPAAEDAEAVRRLRAAGAIPIGKATLHEFVYGSTNDNPHYGPGRNPWDPSRIPGGSSGGSGVVLAADLAIGALGTDTGGSVRIPAALNGVSALRPTYGSVSNRGVFPISATFDTVGPMARSMVDVAQLLSVMVGYDALDPRAVSHPPIDPLAGLDEGLAGLRIGMPRTFFFEDVEPAIDRAVRAAAEQLAALGADVVDIDVPGAERAMQDVTLITRADALALHRERLEAHPDWFGEDLQRRLALGHDISGADFAAAIGRMYEWRTFMLGVFADVDLILTPTTNSTAIPIDTAETISATAQMTRFTYAWSMAHMPAASVPCGFDEHGLPIGLQLAAAPWQDAVVLRAGVGYQAVTDWHRRRTPLGEGW